MSKYIKPTISFRELNMAKDISAGCSVSSNADPMACPVELPGQPGLMIFGEGTNGCDAYFPGVEDTICYHVPVADQNVFGS